MAARESIGRAGEAMLRNHYLKRVIEDDELRGRLVAAYGAARSAYGRMSNGKPATRALFEDKKLQRELGEAVTALRDASNALKEPRKKARRKGGPRRSLLVLIVGTLLALALSESLRSKVLDLFFGAEEEFDYSSSTSAQDMPAPAGASAS